MTERHRGIATDFRSIECIYVLMDLVRSGGMGPDEYQPVHDGLIAACAEANRVLAGSLLMPSRIVAGDDVAAVLRPEAESGMNAFVALVRCHLPQCGFHVGAARGTLWAAGSDAAAAGGPAFWAAEGAAGKSRRHGLKYPGWELDYPTEVLLSEP